ncbi:MAG: LysM peptidoglycan-binding domain-containing protein, partial [Acidaminobacteraceae bacterium]
MNFEEIRDKCANKLAKAIAVCATPFYKGVKKVEKLELPSKRSLNNKFNLSKIFEKPQKYYENNRYKLEKPFEFVKAKKIYMLVGTAGVTIALVGVITLANASTDVTNPVVLEKITDPVQVTASKTNENENDLVSSDIIKYTKDVNDIMDMSIYGYELRSNNKEAGFFKGKIEALDILNTLRSSYVDKLTDSKLLDSYFKELTSIEPAYKSITEWDGVKTKEEALNYIIKGTKEETFHEVAKGENFWTIASLYNVTVESLESANPDLKPERIQIGRKISLTVPKPLITVVTVEEAEYIENIEYAVEYKDDSSVYKGESRIANNGKNVEKKVVSKII